MNKPRNFLWTIVLIIIGLGLYTTLTNQNAPKINDVTYFELKETVEKHERDTMTLVEQDNGTVLLQIGEQYYQTKVNPTDNNIKALLDEHKITYSYKEEVGFFEGLFKAALPIFVIFLILTMLFNRNQGGAGKAQEMVKRHAKRTEIPTTSLEDVGGLSEETKNEVKQIIEIFKHKEQAKLLGIRPPKGAMLYGPPGTGKTLLAKAIARALGANFYSASGSSFVEMFVGVGASRIREMFEEARKNKPALIFIDEFDSLAKKRGTGQSNEERESTLNELLTQLDGVESNEDIFILVATNRLDIIDPAVLRPGRFDYKILIGQPDLEGRKEIIHIHSKNKRISQEVKEKLSFIAEATIGYSGAEIEAVFNNAAKKALSQKRNEITMDDIHYALDLSVLGNANRKLRDEDTRRRVAYHEAGHALVGLVTKPKSVRKATIIPRGDALGFVAPLPKEMELSTTSELIDRISMILAGGVAEMKKFGEHSIGVSGDVQQAKNIIEQMVDLGMKEDDFVLSFTEKDKQTEMKNIYQKALDQCKQILSSYEEQWEKLTVRLLEKETLSGEEIERIVEGLPEPEELEELKDNDSKATEEFLLEENTPKKKEKQPRLQEKLEEEPI